MMYDRATIMDLNHHSRRGLFPPSLLASPGLADVAQSVADREAGSVSVHVRATLNSRC